MIRASYWNKSVRVVAPCNVFNETKAVGTERDHEKALVFSAYRHCIRDKLDITIFEVHCTI